MTCQWFLLETLKWVWLACWDWPWPETKFQVIILGMISFWKTHTQNKRQDNSDNILIVVLQRTLYFLLIFINEDDWPWPSRSLVVTLLIWVYMYDRLLDGRVCIWVLMLTPNVLPRELLSWCQKLCSCLPGFSPKSFCLQTLHRELKKLLASPEKPAPNFYEEFLTECIEALKPVNASFRGPILLEVSPEYKKKTILRKDNLTTKVAWG